MILSYLVMLTIAQAVCRVVFCKHLKPECGGTKVSCARGRCSDSFTSQRFSEERKPLPLCSCDPHCRYLFNDCCYDYETHCGGERHKAFSSPRDTTHSSFRWGCRKIFPDPTIDESLFMVDKCMIGWPDDERSRNCTTRNALSLNDILLAVPVTNQDEVLFRNVYCALCNGLRPDKLTFWEVKFAGKDSESMVGDPKKIIKLSYDPSTFNKSLDISDMRFYGNTLGMRICQNFTASCHIRTQDKVLRDACENGPAALISVGTKLNFKSYKCLECNYQNESSIPKNLMCGPQYEHIEEETSGEWMKYSLIFGAEHYSSFRSERICPEGYLFDKKNTRCLKHYQFPKLSSIQTLKALYISIEYEGAGTNTNKCRATINSSNEKTVFVNRFMKILHKETDKNTSVSHLNVIPGLNNYLVAFRIVKTVEQHARNLSNDTATTSQLNDFTSSFKTPIRTKMCLYVPRTARSKEMTCIQNRTFSIDMQDVGDKSTIFLKETQKNYSRGEFWIFEKDHATVVVICEHFIPTNCSHFINTTDASDWFLFSNLSLFYNVIGVLFEYGEYSISNNYTLSVCLSQKTLLNQPTKRVEIESIHDDVLSKLSIVTNVVSITSLFVLITVYALFPSLRNLPGKNLMLMSAALAIAQLLWLLEQRISSTISNRCDVMLIVLHYIFLAYFASSGTMAYHSYKTFRSLSEGRLMQRTESRFVWYALYSLGCPLVTVALFWTIDFYNVLEFRYGISDNGCWFGKGDGMYIAFAGPLFLQLLLNILLLLVTLRIIYKCSKDHIALSEENGGARKRDVGIYLRMSTLMGLTWIFGVLLLAFPGVLAYDYLFTIGNGLQGFYIATAFLSTKTVRRLLGCKTKSQRERSTTRQL